MARNRFAAGDGRRLGGLVQQLPERVGGVLCNVLLAHYEQLHPLLQQVACERDGDGRLKLVARQHPYLHPCVPHGVNRLGHAFLQLVLHRGRPKQLQPALDLRGTDCHLARAVLDGDAGLLEVAAPLGPLGLRQNAPPHAERAQAEPRVCHQMILRSADALLIGPQALHDNRVSALAVDDDLARGAAAAHGAHAPAV